jgi:hypothetical protein
MSTLKRAYILATQLLLPRRQQTVVYTCYLRPAYFVPLLNTRLCSAVKMKLSSVLSARRLKPSFHPAIGRAPLKAAYHDSAPSSHPRLIHLGRGSFSRGPALVLSHMSRRIERSLVTSVLDHSLLLMVQIGEATNLGVLKGASSFCGDEMISSLLIWWAHAGFAGVIHL